MDVLYPLPAFSAPDSNHDSGTTILVTHLVAADRRAEFMDSLQALLQDFVRAGGAAGYKVYEEKIQGGSRITVLQRFASAASQEAWMNSEGFSRWKQSIAPLRPRLEHFQTYSGIAALFAAGQSPDAPPTWKMAVVLMIAVFPLSLALSHWFGRALASTPPLVGALISTPVMVILMTYVMVPLLTKLFASWLQPSVRS